jgi:PAS domain S-box-containing protein
VLNSSEERFRLLIEAVKDYAIFMLDTKGYITTWNLGAERITGYRANEIIGKHFSIFYTKEDLAINFPQEELLTAKDKGHFETEGIRVRKDGSTFWANVVVVPLYDQEQRLTGYSKVTRDITQLREADTRMRRLNEELEKRVKSRTMELQHREAQLRSITNALPVLVGQLDNQERFLFANEAFCKWFGKTSDEIIDSTFEEVVGKERYPDNAPYIKKALTGKITSYERESVSQNQSMVFSVTLVPEFDDRQNVSGCILVATDITKHKENESELKKAKEAAEIANMTKSAFLANMSHEIRTPLGAVLGFSELMMNQEITASERLNNMEIIKKNGRMLSNIINDILDLSKVEAGRLEVERIDIPFVDVMTEIGSLLNLEATEKGIVLKVTSEGIIPNMIKTDPLRIRQILLNIIGNAIKFTERGSVEVKVKLGAEAAGDTKLAFVVTDTGEGIKPEQAARLFTPFTQADVSTTRRFGGTGLGLVLSKKLANALGGDIVLKESTPSVGSTFVITIDPGTSQEILFQSGQFSDKITRLPVIDRPTNLTTLKVLVVDDSPENQLLINKFLTMAGARVETANNGREGVQKALKGQFNLILMDLQMPEMDGFEAMAELRKLGYTQPIIALTAHAMKEDRRRCLESGFNDHLTKPIDRHTLLQTLAEYCS